MYRISPKKEKIRFIGWRRDGNRVEFLFLRANGYVVAPVQSPIKKASKQQKLTAKRPGFSIVAEGSKTLFWNGEEAAAGQHGSQGRQEVEAPSVMRNCFHASNMADDTRIKLPLKSSIFKEAYEKNFTVTPK